MKVLVFALVILHAVFIRNVFSLIITIPAHITGTILRENMAEPPVTTAELLAYSQYIRSKEDLEANLIRFTALIVEDEQPRSKLYLVHAMRTSSRIVPIWTTSTIATHLPSPKEVLLLCDQQFNFPRMVSNYAEAQTLHRQKMIEACNRSS